MVRQTSKWGQLFLLSLVCVGATAFLTAWFYRLDEIITVPGRLVPQKGGVQIKSPIDGQLAEVKIKNGDQVEKEDVLVRFDVKTARVDLDVLKNQLTLEKKSVKDKLTRNNQSQKTAIRTISLTKEIIARLEPLEKKGAISELQLLEKKNLYESQKDRLEQLKTERKQIMNQSKSKTTELTGRVKKTMQQLKNEFVKAPISGTVFDLIPDNDSYVTRNAEPLLKLIPKGTLGAEINIFNKDIGFIRKGQPVKVRVDSFPYTQYGEIEGEISRIGADASPPNKLINQYHFPVDLELQRSELETKDGIKIPLQAGMTITTNLKLRDRRLIEIISDIFTNKGESLKRLRQS